MQLGLKVTESFTHSFVLTHCTGPGWLTILLSSDCQVLLEDSNMSLNSSTAIKSKVDYTVLY